VDRFERTGTRERTYVPPSTVALTFDDGPDPVWTPQVLAELERGGAATTFFVDAQRADANRSLIAAIEAGGHEVGLHCFEHVRHSELDEAAIAADTVAGLGLLEEIGVSPSAWRAPWGDVTAATRRVAAEQRLKLWDWNVDSHDWRGDSCEEMLLALEAEGGLCSGAVVLMHDGIGPGALRSGCAQTVRLTAALLELAAAGGLRTVAISDMPRETA